MHDLLLQAIEAIGAEVPWEGPARSRLMRFGE